jgi:glycosyltransferase involved in cell wall biosynthesis
MPIADIIVPCYRYGHFLERCVASVLAQGIPDIRILIIDDASPDGSGAVARSIAGRDQRITTIVHPVNRGHIATYNEGIAWAEARYMLLLSADDMLAPGALARAIDVMEKNSSVVLTYGGWIEILGDEDKAAVPASGEHDWHIHSGAALIEKTCATAINQVVTVTAILRTTAQKAAGFYDAELTHSGDMEMWLRLATLGDVAETRAVQGVRGVHGENMSLVAADVLLRDYLQRELAFATFFAGPGSALSGADRLHRLAIRRLAEQAFWTGMAQCWRGNRAGGRALLRFAVRLNPRFAMAPPLGHLLRAPGMVRRLGTVVSERAPATLWRQLRRRAPAVLPPSAP